MKIYYILEEERQDEFVDRHGESADPASRVAGIYTSKKSANEAVALMRKRAASNVAELGCDLTYYYVVEEETK